MKRLWNRFCEWISRKLEPTESEYGEDYDHLCALERAALRACDRKMYAYARVKRIKLLEKRLKQLKAAKMKEIQRTRINACKRCG